MANDLIEKMGMFAGTALPLFNIPLIIRLLKRKSSDDFSIFWALGIWSCSVVILPQALRTDDMAFKLFGIVNVVFFSMVTFLILKYRRKA